MPSRDTADVTHSSGGGGGGGLGGLGEKIGFLQDVPFSADSSVWWVAGFVGVYIAGHILEATKSWSAVFNQTAGVCMVGWVVFIVFGTGKQIV